MRKYLNFCLLIALLSVFTVASAQNKGKKSHEPSASVMISSGDQHFWVFIDNERLNDSSTSSIRVNGIPEGQHYLRVEMDNSKHDSIGQNVNLQGFENTFRIEKQRNLYVLSEDSSLIKPEIEVFFKQMQQNRHIHGGDNPDYNGDRHASRRGTPRNSGDGDYIGDSPTNEGSSSQHPSQEPNQSPNQAAANNSEDNNPKPGPMPDDDFQQALGFIQNETFEKAKNTNAEQIIDNNMLSLKQIREICILFDTESTRLNLVQHAYPKCTEKENYKQLNNLFELSSSKEEFDKFLKSQK